MTKLSDKKVLVTGGGSGIGKLIGEMALEAGASHLYVWDIDPDSMEAFRSGSEHRDRIFTRVVDVSKKQELVDGVRAIGAENVDVLINNAGIVAGREFREHTHDDIERTMAVNTTALMHLTLLILPEMRRRKQGHIVNIASAAGMIGNPRMSVYAASKWAVLGWSESVRLELKKEKSPVRLTIVTPSYISTGMFDGVKTHPISPVVSPEKAARKIIRGIEKNKVYVRMPWSVYLLPVLKGLLPASWFDVVVGKYLKVYSSMDEFKGKSQT